MTTSLDTAASQSLADWAMETRYAAKSPFAAAQQLVRRLGAHWNGRCAEFGFWVPELPEQRVPNEQIVLEILTPLEPLNLRQPQQRVRFRRERVNMVSEDDYLWGVVDGVTPGRRGQIGSFYWLRYREASGLWKRIVDPLALSVPFGAFAPAELYDVASLHVDRADADYFRHLDERAGTEIDPDGVQRITGPLNLLEIHAGTASDDGTLAGLCEIYATIGDKLRRDEPLSTAEQNWVGYDGIQLMPIEPTIVYEGGPAFWQEVEEQDDEITVELRRPDMTNWGYDVITVASPAVNPGVLRSGRPDEFVDLLSTLHNFPGRPIKLVLDVVYGHADNQTTPLLNRHYFAGTNMYGRNLNYQQPVVRAVLLEMQRRKSDFGVDGVRVDGAQDFKWWDDETGLAHHDDEFLALMNDVEQVVPLSGDQKDECVRYRPWMVFEDGRPWPRNDWELASTYREVTKNHPNVVQWGPLTFAHNTPFLFTFWVSKWWRIEEIMQVGEQWITGCANHDTLRRGTQVDPEARINTFLGTTMPDILRNAYDNAAAHLFDYVLSPGIPMGFINASMRAPWSFIRNVDDRYGVKVVAEETFFLDWCVTELSHAADDAFVRLKALGFADLRGLRRFLHVLNHAVQATEYDLRMIASLLNSIEPPLEGPLANGDTFDAAVLKQIARAWMDDVYDYCTVTRWVDKLDTERVAYNLAVRNFRRERPWLRNNHRGGEHAARLRPLDGSVVFYGLRQSPDDFMGKAEQVLFVANMEGEPHTLTPLDLPIPNLALDGWQVALAAPGVAVDSAGEAVTLSDSEGLVFVRKMD